MTINKNQNIITRKIEVLAVREGKISNKQYWFEFVGIADGFLAKEFYSKHFSSMYSWNPR
jgi:hypothetical protein